MVTVAELEFKECDACAAKPGSPQLCMGCIYNMEVIAVLKQDRARLQEKLDVLKILINSKY